MIGACDWPGHPPGLVGPGSIILCWEAELSFFNDTCFLLLGPRFGWATGMRSDEVRADVIDRAMPIIDAAFATTAAASPISR